MILHVYPMLNTYSLDYNRMQFWKQIDNKFDIYSNLN